MNVSGCRDAHLFALFRNLVYPAKAAIFRRSISAPAARASNIHEAFQMPGLRQHSLFRKPGFRTALRAPFPERGPVEKVPELWGISVKRAAGDQLSCKA